MLMVIILMIAVNIPTIGSMWLTLLLRPLMHGVSIFKINFLLLFILLCGLAGLLWSKSILGQRPKWLDRIAFSAIAIGATMGMISFFETSLRLGVPLNRHMYFFSHEFNSINYFAHIHTTKAGLHHLVTAIGLDGISQFADTGRALGAYVNRYLALTVLAAASVALVTLVVRARYLLIRWSGWRQAAILVLYSVSGSHVIKCIIDGGPLAYDFLPSALSLYLLLCHSQGEEIASVVRRLWFRILVIFVLFLALASTFSLDTALFVQPLQYAYFSSFLILLWLPLVFDQIRSRYLVPAALVLSGIFGFYYYTHCIPDMIALNARVNENHKILKLGWQSAKEPSKPAGSTISDITQWMLGKKLFQVYRDCGDDPLRNRNLVVKSADDARYTGFLFALRVLKSNQEMKLESNDQIKFLGAAQPVIGNDSTFVFRIRLDPHLFPSLWRDSPTLRDQNNDFAVFYYLNRYFSSRGLTDYVLIPLLL